MSAMVDLDITGRWSISHSRLFSTVNRIERISLKCCSIVRPICSSCAAYGLPILVMSEPAPPM